MINAIFVNLPIENLKRSVDFFGALGFKFNAQFTSETTTCMLVGKDMYAMLLEKADYAGFIDKPVADAHKTSEVLISLSMNSSDEVREICEKAFSLGARNYQEPRDLGFMFSWGFEDLDGHIWEFFYMNPEHVQPTE